LDIDQPDQRADQHAHHKGLEESGHSAQAAELKLVNLKLIKEVTARPIGCPAKVQVDSAMDFTSIGLCQWRHRASNSASIMTLFKGDCGSLRMSRKTVRKALASKRLILPAEGRPRLSIRIKQSRQPAGKISLSITGRLPDAPSIWHYRGVAGTIVSNDSFLTVVFHKISVAFA